MTATPQQFLEMSVAIGEARRRGLPSGFAIIQQYCDFCRRWREHIVYQHSLGSQVVEIAECDCGHREIQTRFAKPPTNG